MPYLICDQCGAYYELEKGESSQDFELICDCGGKLEYYPNKYDYYKNHIIDRNSKKTDSLESFEINKTGFKGFINSLDSQIKGLITIGVFVILLFLVVTSGIFSSLGPSYLDVMPPEIQAAKTPILVELYAPRCSACQKLDSETMTNLDVQTKLSGYSYMKINVDTDSELASRFDTNVIPTLILLGADGKEIRRNEGYMDANELLNFLKI